MTQCDMSEGMDLKDSTGLCLFLIQCYHDRVNKNANAYNEVLYIPYMIYPLMIQSASSQDTGKFSRRSFLCPFILAKFPSVSITISYICPS